MTSISGNKTKLNSNYIALFLSVLFLVGAFFITNQVTQEADEYKKKKELVVNDILGFQKRLLNYKEALPEIWDKEWQQKKDKSETILFSIYQGAALKLL